MNYKSFPDVYWQKIESSLNELKATGQPIYAAFDADGTLWDTDLGENFFHYQIEEKQVALPPDPWTYYLELKKLNNDPRAAYVWLAQINQSKPLEQVRKWAQQAFDQIQPNPIFSEQQKLIQLLKKNGVQVYVVTASIKWAVEPGARALGLTDDQVIGVETEVKNGLVTDIPVYPITYRAGKTEALLRKTQDQRPFLSSGNTVGDLELLLSATHIRLAVSAASRDDRLFKTENELMQKAEEFNWLSHRFV
jgi:HAD superfamily phosphoserine phosphatase-like hydrolase